MSVKMIILNYMGDKMKMIFNPVSELFFEEIEEIRMRCNNPVMINHKGLEFYLSHEGKLVNDISQGYSPSVKDIGKIMELASNYSLYAFEEELRNGYISLPGGHRIGITGKVVVEKYIVKTIKNINGLNIRISHEIKGCSDNVIDYVIGQSIMHTMIISPPACGKTTLLRDMIRQLSNGIAGKLAGQAVGVVDERSEIAGCYMGIPQNDVGQRTDILDGCPKAEGMIMLLRSMSPKVIAVDEIGKSADIHAIEDIINAGIKLICTVHGSSLEDIKSKPVLAKLLKKNIFQRFIILKAPGQIAGIYDENYKDIYSEGIEGKGKKGWEQCLLK